MKAILTPAKPEPVTKNNIVVNDKAIGYIEYNERGKYHVVIDAHGSEGGGLYQGHGDTPELAIQELLERHDRFATAQLRRIFELRDLLSSDEPCEGCDSSPANCQGPEDCERLKLLVCPECGKQTHNSPHCIDHEAFA